MRIALAATVLLIAGCAGRAPAPNDPQLAQGTVLALPVPEPFPRLGLQWTYDVSRSGWPKDEHFPPMTAYRLTDRNAFGHPWGGWWLYKNEEACAGTGATFRRDPDVEYVFWHPPRMFSFGALQVAPWPVVNAGKPGKKEYLLTIGAGWGELEGKEVRRTYEDLRYESIEVPAGKFESAWRMDGESPDWKGSFWWVKSVGFVLMDWTAKDGRKLSLRLKDVRLIESK